MNYENLHTYTLEKLFGSVALVIVKQVDNPIDFGFKDSFQSRLGFLVKKAKINFKLHLEMPKYGGYIGLYQ